MRLKFDVQKVFSALFDCLRTQIISYRVDYSGTLLELPYLNINKHSVCPPVRYLPRCNVGRQQCNYAADSVSR